MVVRAEHLFAALWYCVCILSCIDTGQFVYASLSQTLYPSVLGLLMIVVFGVYCIHERQVPTISIAQIPAICLTVYVLLHGLFIKDPEIYKQGYLVCTLLLIVVLGQPAKTSVIESIHLEYGILLIAFVNIVYLIAQSIGIMDSGNSFFKMTGTTDNPNTAAIALAMSVPFVIHKIEQRKHIAGMYLFLAIAIALIIVLKCRTAYLGIGTIAIYLALRSAKTKQTVLRMAKTRSGILLASCIVMGLLLLLLSGYHWKKESADGRLFIWQRACEMISNNPFGYGYGKYEAEYNLYQSHYFSTHRDAYLQSNLATASGSAYNDILEHGVQGGLPGGALYLIFLLSSVCQAYHSKEKACSMALLAVLLMSMTNSIYCCISPWIMTIAAAAIGMKNCERRLSHQFIGSAIIGTVSVLSVLLLYRNVRLLVSQSVLKAYRNEQNYNIGDVEKLYPAIGTSEAYWRYRAECNERINDSFAADTCYTEARKYTSAPLLLFKAAICKEQVGDEDSALKMLTTAVFMLPKNFSLKYHLMLMYDRTGDRKQARSVAEEIVSTPGKMHNESVNFIKAEAENYLKENNDTYIPY